MVDFDIQPLGDTAVRLQFQGEVSPELNHTIRAYCRTLEKQTIPGVVEWVPAYDTVTVYYSPDRITYKEICERLKSQLPEQGENEEEANIVFIPTLYGGEAGPDLPGLARTHGLTEEEVVKIHSGTDYLIYLMGFQPGFPYLGGLSEDIATPRLDNPRTKVPAGSVGIAGNQTGVYPADSPGGWNLIGRTPVKLFDTSREEPFLYEAGDRIRFVPISEKEYHEVEQQVKDKNFQVKKEVYRHVGKKN